MTSLDQAPDRAALRRTFAGPLIAVGAGALVLAITGTAALVPTAIPGDGPGEFAAAHLESTVADAARLAAAAAGLGIEPTAGS